MTASTLPRVRRWGDSGRADPVARYVAPRLGMRPASVEQLMKQVNHRCAAIVAAFVALGDLERGERFVRPIVAAWDQRQAPPLVDATWHLAQQADAGEEVAELAYQLDPSETNLDRLIRSKDREILHAIALRDALLEEQQRRREAR